MSLQDIGVAVAILSALGGVLIQLVKVIVNQFITVKLKDFKLEINDEFNNVNDRFSNVSKEFRSTNKAIGQLQRRTAILETRVIGDSDTFSGLE